MTQFSPHIPPIGAILTGPHWPSRVRVVRVEPQGASRVLIEAVTSSGTPANLEAAVEAILSKPADYAQTHFSCSIAALPSPM